jgi:hypothetical protein
MAARGEEPARATRKLVANVRRPARRPGGALRESLRGRPALCAVSGIVRGFRLTAARPQALGVGATAARRLAAAEAGKPARAVAVGEGGEGGGRARAWVSLLARRVEVLAEGERQQQALLPPAAAPPAGHLLPPPGDAQGGAGGRVRMAGVEWALAISAREAESAARLQLGHYEEAEAALQALPRRAAPRAGAQHPRSTCQPRGAAPEPRSSATRASATVPRIARRCPK